MCRQDRVRKDSCFNIRFYHRLTADGGGWLIDHAWRLLLRRLVNFAPTDYGRMMAKSLNRIPQTQKHIPLKFLKILVFCRNDDWLIKSHGLGTQNDNICADSSTANTPRFIWPICTNRPIIWDIFEKKN